MNRKISRILFGGLIFLILIALTDNAFANAASLTTDRPIYAPGEKVQINGIGFKSDSSVSLVVYKPDETGQPGSLYFATEVTSDGNGGFIYYYDIIDLLYGFYRVDANDGENFASVTFLTLTHGLNLLRLLKLKEQKLPCIGRLKMEPKGLNLITF